MLAILLIPSCQSKRKADQSTMDPKISLENKTMNPSPDKLSADTNKAISDLKEKSGESPEVNELVSYASQLGPDFFNKAQEDNLCSTTLQNIDAVQKELSTSTNPNEQEASSEDKIALRTGLLLTAFGAFGALVSGAYLLSEAPKIPRSGIALRGLLALAASAPFLVYGPLLISENSPDPTSIKIAQDTLIAGAASSALISLAMTLKWIINPSQVSPVDREIQKSQVPELDEGKTRIREHINERFTELEGEIRSKIQKGQKVKIIIPGGDFVARLDAGKGNTVIGQTVHRLGTGLAMGQWKSAYPGQGEEVSKETIALITEKIQELQRKFPGSDVEFEFKNVSSDLAGLKGNTFQYVLWGANAGNWNYEDGHSNRLGFGGGQAMGIRTQTEGVFGIVTTPTAGLEGISSRANKAMAERLLVKFYPTLTPEERAQIKSHLDKISTNHHTVSNFLDEAEKLRAQPAQKEERNYKKIFGGILGTVGFTAIAATAAVPSLQLEKSQTPPTSNVGNKLEEILHQCANGEPLKQGKN